MNRFASYSIGLVGVMLLLGGCTASEINPISTSEEPFLDSDAVISPLASSSELRLLNEMDMVGVGEELEAVFAGSYRRPEGSTAVSELPDGFDGNFKSTGWQTYRRTFAVLGRDERVILAMDHREKVDEGIVLELAGRYVRQYGAPLGMVESATSTYRFWQDGSVRLMLVEFRGERRGFTAVVGLTKVMDRLGMDLDSANKDAEAADRMIQEFQKK